MIFAAVPISGFVSDILNVVFIEIILTKVVMIIMGLLILVVLAGTDGDGRKCLEHTDRP